MQCFLQMIKRSKGCKNKLKGRSLAMSGLWYRGKSIKIGCNLYFCVLCRIVHNPVGETGLCQMPFSGVFVLCTKGLVKVQKSGLG